MTGWTRSDKKATDLPEAGTKQVGLTFSGESLSETPTAGALHHSPVGKIKSSDQYLLL